MAQLFALEGSWMSDGRWIRERGVGKGVQGEEEEVFPVTPVELMEREGELESSSESGIP